jgi:hypothetical protein
VTIIEPNNALKTEDFYWMVTRFIFFELEYFTTPSIKQEHGNDLMLRLIKFHENLENFEICQKILIYKQKMK